MSAACRLGRRHLHLFPLEGSKQKEPLRLVVDAVEVAELSGVAGEILEADKRFIVATGDGSVELLQVQPAGKRAMATGDFLRGYPNLAGKQLGQST